MKIRFLRACVCELENKKPGDTAEVSKTLGQMFVGNLQAEEITDDEPAKKKVAKKAAKKKTAKPKDADATDES